MMEEVGEDTNGESTFEFVGEKDVLSAPIPSTTAENISAPSPSHQVKGLFSMQAAPSEQPVIAFYDPAQHVDPKATVLPPITNSQQASAGLPTPYVASPGLPTPYTTPAGLPTTPAGLPTPYAAPAGLPKPYVAPVYSQPTEAFSLPPQQPQGLFETSPMQSYSSFSVPMDNSAAVVDNSAPQSGSETGVWGWLKSKDFINKVAEKAKNSVDSVITTLDPGMKEIINSGGDISVIVASGNEVKVSAVREAFQLVFGKATVQGISVQSSSIAPQPVGFSAGLKAAEERLLYLKQQGFVNDQQVLLSIENFLAELTPENWFDIGCFLLQDLRTGASIQLYTEAIPVASQYVMQAKDQTPANYHLGWSGFAVTIGQVLSPILGVHHSEWHQSLTGVSRREILFLAAKTLAGMFKAQLNR